MRCFCLLFFFIIFSSCNQTKPAYRFSNFYDTPAENIVKAIEENDIEGIKHEIIKNRININFKDPKYDIPLLSIALVNNKKESFNELLRLGANTNVQNRSCISPLISAIRNKNKCDLYFVKKLIENRAEITPELFKKCNYFSRDPIQETIFYHNNFSDNDIGCGLKILELLTSKLDNPDLLFLYNNVEDYWANIVYVCISVPRNIEALKYLIIDLKYNVPEEIFINGTVLKNIAPGYVSLTQILKSKEFIFESQPHLEKAKQEILSYLRKNK